MLVTLDVSNDDKSSEVKEEQPENINDRSVAFEVSKLERSNDARDKHPWNARPILVAFEVSSVPRLAVLSFVK